MLNEGVLMGRYRYHVFACTNKRDPEHPRGSCQLRNAEEVLSLFREELKQANIPQPFRINKSGCLDACEEGPVFAVYPDGVYYRLKTREDVRQVVRQHLLNGVVVSDLQIPSPPDADNNG
ncbi:MAG: (2Fe-2S) ferredoxin domain-containing protein [Firmicutes bacterium]|nr:(2Fe-2S) ferredoxin domain-containing protein [Bacillota bacterium]